MPTIPSHLSTIHHIALKAIDLNRMTAFYRDLLGLKERDRFYTPDGDLRSIWFDLGPTILMLELSSTADALYSNPFQADTGYHLLALPIPANTRNAWRTYLEAKGVAIVHKTDFSLYIQDPEGNRLALSHYPNK